MSTQKTEEKLIKELVETKSAISYLTEMNEDRTISAGVRHQNEVNIDDLKGNLQNLWSTLIKMNLDKEAA